VIKRRDGTCWERQILFLPMFWWYFGSLEELYMHLMLCSHPLEVLVFWLCIDYILCIWVDIKLSYLMPFRVYDFMHVVVPWKLIWWWCMMFIFMMDAFHIIVALIDHDYVLKMVDDVLVITSLYATICFWIFFRRS